MDINTGALDILVIASHPDDAEIGCAGTLLSHLKAGYSAGIVDLTRGELGTRGSADIRMAESKEASRRLGIQERENMGFRDGFFSNTEEHQLSLVSVIRKYRPKIVLANAVDDRHPDHGKASKLISDACFLSGLRRVTTHLEGNEQAAWRPAAVYHYIQDYYIKPDFVVDITRHMEDKIHVLSAFKSQFHDPSSTEPETVLSVPDFMERVRSRAREFGKFSAVGYGEGYTVERQIGVKNLFDLV